MTQDEGVPRPGAAGEGSPVGSAQEPSATAPAGLDDRIRAAVENAIRTVGGQAGVVFLMDVAGGLSLRLSLDRHGRHESEPRVSRTFVNTVWSRGTAQVISDPGLVGANCCCVRRPHWALAAPIRSRHGLLGVLAVSGPPLGLHGTMRGTSEPPLVALPALEEIARDLAGEIESATRRDASVSPGSP